MGLDSLWKMQNMFYFLQLSTADVFSVRAGHPKLPPQLAGLRFKPGIPRGSQMLSEVPFPDMHIPHCFCLHSILHICKTLWYFSFASVLIPFTVLLNLLPRLTLPSVSAQFTYQLIGLSRCRHLWAVPA